MQILHLSAQRDLGGVLAGRTGRLNAPSGHLGDSFPLNMVAVDFCTFKMSVWIAEITN